MTLPSVTELAAGLIGVNLDAATVAFDLLHRTPSKEEMKRESNAHSEQLKRAELKEAASTLVEGLLF